MTAGDAKHRPSVSKGKLAADRQIPIEQSVWHKQLIAKLTRHGGAEATEALDWLSKNADRLNGLYGHKRKK